MSHDTGLIALLAGGIGLAFVLGLLATRLRIPPIVGYLAAGVLIGPSTPGFTADADLAGQLSEFGVILLMFGVGIHFSLRDLFAVRKIAVPGAILHIVAAAVFGLAARLWGWSWTSGLILGLCLSVASTVVLLRAMEERGALDTRDGRIAVGWLIVEDLVTVLLLVLLPPLAGPLGGEPPGDDKGEALWLTLGRTVLALGGFVVMMGVVGRRAVPWLLERVARTGSRELFTLCVLAIALGVAVGASTLFGVSFALGAFLAGTVVNGSHLSHEAARDALPMQDAFSVLFFVAVGMIVDPSILVDQPLEVAAVLAMVLVGKSVTAYAIVRAFRYPPRTALIISASLAQIGEFSFILGALVVELRLMPVEGQSLLMAAAVGSITINPLAFWLADRLAGAPDDQTGPDPSLADLQDHAIIVGFGRVGRLIGEALERAGRPFVAVDDDEDTISAARARGIAAVLGDGSRLEVLQRTGLERARLLVIATPEPFVARAIIERARSVQRDLEVIARAHSPEERAYLSRAGSRLALVPERELAFALAHHALRQLGADDDEADRHIDTLRAE